MHGERAAKKAILTAKTIAIASHINPDGDSIGSLLSLGLGLEKIGKTVYFISRDGVPKRYRKLPGAGRIVRKLTKPVDLAIAVDCSNKEILGETYDYFKTASKILEIDHHDFRRPFGDVRFINERAAAVGEMIYILLELLKVEITKEIAQNLMTSIVVETDSFRLPNISKFTFEVCGKLVRHGMDVYNLIDMVFWSKTKESAILSGLCMSRCRFLKNDRLVWSIITKADFKKEGGASEDVDAVPDDMRAIKTAKIAVLFRENSDNMLRVSLRSKDKLNVAAIAEEYNGGGHFDVAGCTIPNSPVSIKKFLNRAERLLP